MSNLFGLNKPNTNLRKNVFDLSEKSLYSLSAGMLLPVMCKEANPGEKFQINLSSLTRTMPLNTAAFVRCRQYYHFFFVPYKQLWIHWDNFINGVDYRTSALQAKNSNLSGQVPSFDLVKFVREMVKSGKVVKRYKTKTVGHFKRRLIKYEVGSSVVNENSRDEHGYLYGLGISRLLDMLGYGINIDGYKSLTDFLSRTIKNPSDASTLDNLINSKLTNSVNVNPFRLLAYQKIYNDFYKRDDYEATNPLAWNIDDLSGGSQNMSSLELDRLLEITRLRYRWLPKDYFTGVVPSELYGLENVINNLADSSSKIGGVDIDELGIINENNNVYIDRDSGASTKSIRAAFAIEKLMRLTRRAGGFDYISQTAAHYGFEPPKGRGDKVEFIGGFTNDINISEVITTTNYANELEGEAFGNTVGQIYGRGFGVNSNNKEIEYQAKEHGVIMCITSIVPELDYSAEGLNRFNSKFSRGDYFQPELQDLGLQPVFKFELKNDVLETDKTKILGFVPMYSEYKTAYDTLHGQFRNGGSLSAWSASQLVSCDDVSNKSGVNISSLKINPKCLDRLFSVSYDGSEETDQFMCSSQFIVKSIRPMSVTGQNL